MRKSKNTKYPSDYYNFSNTFTDLGQFINFPGDIYIYIYIFCIAQKQKSGGFGIRYDRSSSLKTASA